MNIDDTDKILEELRGSLEKGDILEIHIVKNEDTNEGKINLSESAKTLLANWKRIIIITLIFALGGAILGYVYNNLVQGTELPSADLFKLPAINMEDDYTDTLKAINVTNANMIIYLDALIDSVRNSQYKERDNDLTYLNGLKNNIVQTYREKIELAQYIDQLYNPLPETDNEKVILQLEIRQKNYETEIQALEAEISYLQGIASGAVTLQGNSADTIVATGASKARSLAYLKISSQNNADLLKQYSGTRPTQEIIERSNRMDRLISEAWSVYEDTAREINTFAQDYIMKNTLNIIVAQSVDKAGAAVYTVNLEKPALTMPASQRITRIILLFVLIGLGVGCMRVLKNTGSITADQEKK